MLGIKMVKDIGGMASKVAVRTGLKLRKASPEIMLVGGLIAGATAIVTAVIATKKISEDEELKDLEQELDDIKNEADEDIDAVMNDDTVELHGYSSKEECIKDIKKTKKQKGFRVLKKLIWKYVKAYGLSAFLVLLSMALILASHGVLKKRYISTTIAYKALDEAFKDYRERVKEAVGEEKERHYYNGTHEGGEDTVIDENGEAHTTKVAVKDIKKKNSPYEFDFNAMTAPGNWESNSDYNLMFLRSIENYLNDLLNSRGHVFLNEALDALGMKRTREGSVVGWLKGSGGDDYVDLGFTEYYTDEYSDVQDGYLRNIHLNFNVDGLIWDKI